MTDEEFYRILKEYLSQFKDKTEMEQSLGALMRNAEEVASKVNASKDDKDAPTPHPAPTSLKNISFEIKFNDIFEKISSRFKSDTPTEEIYSQMKHNYDINYSQIKRIKKIVLQQYQRMASRMQNILRPHVVGDILIYADDAIKRADPSQN